MQHVSKALRPPGSRQCYRATISRTSCLLHAWCLLAMLATHQQLVQAVNGFQTPTMISSAGAAQSRLWCSLASLATSTEQVNLSHDYTMNLVSKAAAAIANESHSWGVDWGVVGDSPASSQGSSIQHAVTAGQLLKQFTGCVDEAHNSTQAVSYDSIVGAVLPNFKVLAGWWKTEQQPQFPLTLATFTNTHRLNQLQAQCQAWPGPLSVVLYQPLHQSTPGPLSADNKRVLRLAILRMMHLISQVELQAGGCQLSVLLVYELIGEESAMPLLPLNALRNLARLQARTPLVAVLDVDLVASKTLYKRFLNESGAAFAHEKASQQEVLVLPAFELSPAYDTLAWADTIVTAPDASVMKSMLKQKVVGQVHAAKYDIGHRIVNYKSWVDATADYTVQYEVGAEPYVAGSRQLMPWFDERYRGYGWDKCQQLLSMASWKYTVMHDVSVIHRPHVKSTIMIDHTYKSIQQDRPPLLKYIDDMYEQQKKVTAAGEAYQPAINVQLQNCVAKLGWWKEAVPVQGQGQSATTAKNNVERVNTDKQVPLVAMIPP